jgi:hypothetical protein
MIVFAFVRINGVVKTAALPQFVKVAENGKSA